MKKQLLLAVVLLGAFGIANADAPKAKGFYVGGSAGNVVIDDDNALAGFLVDDSDTVLTVFAGYKFFQYLSLEARYSNLGSYDVAIDELDVKAVSVNVVGMIPFGTSGWELFGQVGLAQMDVNVAASNETATTAGIGVRWHINQSIAIGAEIDAYVWSDDDLGSQFDLGVATQQLTFQINF